VVNVEDLRSK
jgi:uncharacterized membrane protein